MEQFLAGKCTYYICWCYSRCLTTFFFFFRIYSFHFVLIVIKINYSQTHSSFKYDLCTSFSECRVLNISKYTYIQPSDYIYIYSYSLLYVQCDKNIHWNDMEKRCIYSCNGTMWRKKMKQQQQNLWWICYLTSLHWPQHKNSIRKLWNAFWIECEQNMAQINKDKNFFFLFLGLHFWSTLCNKTDNATHLHYTIHNTQTQMYIWHGIISIFEK